MPTGPTPRQRARAETIERIKVLALAQLAETGASELSLRGVARDLNLVSSAIYRYVATRDDLITMLVLDAYADVADVLVAAADHPRRTARRRWADVCHALRGWAVAAPHRFALIYGSAIPGYAAPRDTVEPAAAVIRAFCAPAAAGDDPPAAAPALPRDLRAQLGTAAAGLDLDVAPDRMLALTGAFARVVGALTLELNGHFVGAFEPADALFAALVEREADLLGL